MNCSIIWNTSCSYHCCSCNCNLGICVDWEWYVCIERYISTYCSSNGNWCWRCYIIINWHPWYSSMNNGHTNLCYKCYRWIYSNSSNISNRCHLHSIGRILEYAHYGSRATIIKHLCVQSINIYWKYLIIPIKEAYFYFWYLLIKSNPCYPSCITLKLISTIKLV